MLYRNDGIEGIYLVRLYRVGLYTSHPLPLRDGRGGSPGLTQLQEVTSPKIVLAGSWPEFRTLYKSGVYRREVHGWDTWNKLYIQEQKDRKRPGV